MLKLCLGLWRCKRRGGLPRTFDWKNAFVFVKFIKGLFFYFFKITLKFSTSFHLVLSLVTGVEMVIIFWVKCLLTWKCLTSIMEMKNINQSSIVIVLDSRYNLQNANYCYSDVYDQKIACLFTIDTWDMKHVLKTIKYLAMWILKWGFSCKRKFYFTYLSLLFPGQQATKDLIELKNNFNIYLSEACKDIDDNDVHVLNWWKVK